MKPGDEGSFLPLMAATNGFGPPVPAEGIALGYAR